jgi:hypothetical protein
MLRNTEVVIQALEKIIKDIESTKIVDFSIEKRRKLSTNFFDLLSPEQVSVDEIIIVVTYPSDIVED